MVTHVERQQEWKQGWPVIAGIMACSGFGIPLFYYVTSLFLDGMRTEFGASPGEMSNAQAMVVVGALIAPLIGRWLDRFGFRRIFGLCLILLVLTYIVIGTIVDSLTGFAIGALMIGAIGVGCGPLSYTRPIAAWFFHSRGLALGLAAIGVALTTTFVAPELAQLIAERGWRAGFFALAVLAVLFALPPVLFLVKDAPPTGDVEQALAQASSAQPTETPPSHFGDRDFWLLCGSMICMAIPGAGVISQVAPILADEGLGPTQAAYGITAYAIGQVIGRIVAGWFLDRANPRLVAFVFTAVPALGFVLLAMGLVPFWIAVIAIGMVGVQQGAEIDLFAWFTARRYGLARYSSIYGWVIAASWIGNAAGILTFGWLRDWNGNYVLAEWIACALLLIGATAIALVNVRPTVEANAA